MNSHDEACAPGDVALDDTDAILADEAATPAYGAEAGRCDASDERDPQGSAATLAARLAAHDRARRTLFDWMHPARLAELPYAERLGDLDGARAAALAEAFLAGAGFPVPALARFEPVDAALALLAPPDVLAMFRLRALLDYADEVQAWIDRPRRAWLAGWVGAAGSRLLLTRRRELRGESSMAARLMRAPVLDEQAGDALAWRGLRLFARECGWGADAPLAMLELALPAAAAELPLAQFLPLPTRRAPGLGATDREVVRLPSFVIVAQLVTLFPEATW